MLRGWKVDGDGGVVEDALLLLLAAAALHHARLLGIGFGILHHVYDLLYCLIALLSTG